MRKKTFVAALVLGLVAAGPLAGSEAVWEVRVPSGLPRAAFVLPDPLPRPAVLASLAEELLDAAAPRFVPQLAAPVRVPAFPPAAKPGKFLFDANLVLLVGLNAADYVSTRAALKYPGLSETNPLMRPFVKNPAVFAAAKFGTTALSYWCMKSLFKKSRTAAWIVTTASNALLSYAVANNYRLIQGARAR
ncbi:MAG TPA: DUF5658 family protein [Candidatus Aminicenantes bacterium]|nr:DUF5658 family protein [Candidatus Aminicenantes bacterium]